MATIERLEVTWTGFIGGPGLSVFYATPGGSVAAFLRAAFESVKILLPNTVTLTFPDSGDQIEDTTGELVGSWSGATPATVVGTSSVDYAASSGALITWLTDGIVAGRRVRGRTFFVPMNGSAFDPTGLIGASEVGTLQTAMGNAVALGDGHQCIWSRPTDSRPGSHHAVTAARVLRKGAVLRKRRD